MATTIRTALATRPARLTRDRLTCDAATDLIVREGGELLATHRSRPGVTTATRRAVAARDQGCRFPGCQAPVNWCDVHHIVPRAAGGDHHPANLVLLCRRHHTTIHRRGWRQRVTVDGGYEISRRGRTWTTWPRHHHQLPVPAHGSPGGARPSSSGLDPPGAAHPPGAAPPPDAAHRPDAARPSGTLARPDRARSPHDPDPPLPF